MRMAASHQAVAQANERWPRNFSPAGRACNVLAKAEWLIAKLTDAIGHSGGVVIDGMVAKDVLSNWRGPPRPGEKSAEQGRPYNRQTGKAAEGERASDGSVIATTRGNARRARGPCCL